VIGGVPHTLATQGWWIVSRSSGLVAFVLVTISVFLGLTMAGKPVRQPGFARTMKALHEQTALAALVAIGVHGLAILADPWLKPGVAGVTVPFALGSHRFSVAAGIVAAYLALLLGLSFYFAARSVPGSGARRTGRPSPSTSSACSTRSAPAATPARRSSSSGWSAAASRSPASSSTGCSRPEPGDVSGKNGNR
jgi:hypothetical protein